jgi:hypothetical protein
MTFNGVPVGGMPTMFRSARQAGIHMRVTIWPEAKLE